MNSAPNLLNIYLPGSVVNELDNYMGVHYGQGLIWINFDGVAHSEIRPAYLEYKGERLSVEEWYYNGRLNRIGLPASILYFDNGKIKSQKWIKNGLYHRLNGPSVLIYNINGILIKEKWYVEGHRHRTDGPAIRLMHVDGQIREELWYFEDKHHRIEGPAAIWYDRNGIIFRELCWINGQLRHKPQGLSTIGYDPIMEVLNNIHAELSIIPDSNNSFLVDMVH